MNRRPKRLLTDWKTDPTPGVAGTHLLFLTWRRGLFPAFRGVLFARHNARGMALDDVACSMNLDAQEVAVCRE